MFSQAAKRDYSKFLATLCEFAWADFIIYCKWSRSKSIVLTSFSPDFLSGYICIHFLDEGDDEAHR